MEPAMPMQTIETKILQNAVYMRLADDPDPEKASYWIEFELPNDKLTLPMASGPNDSLRDVERRFVGAVRLAALRYVQDLIGEETRRLATVVGR